MATVIPADRFESNSAYAFILRENPKASGIEIQFPLDCTEYEWKARWADNDRTLIRDRIYKATNGFIALIEKEGFRQAHGNPFLWFVKENDPEQFKARISKARAWIGKCATKGAYEIDADVPVERTKSRRRKAPANSSPSVNEPSAQPVSNKLADAIASVLLPQIMEAVGASQQTKELEREVDRLRMQVEDLQELRAKYEVENMTLASERDAALAKVKEMEDAIAQTNEEVRKFRNLAVELERDRDSLKLTLSELGVGEEFTDSSPEVDWDESPVSEPEPEAVSWDDDESSPTVEAVEKEFTASSPEVDWDEDLGESQSDSKSKDEPDASEDTSESEGFDLDSLGEL